MTNTLSTPPHEEKEIRCPKLGGLVHFDYCRREQGDCPCSRALACWSPHFDVEAYFREILTREAFEKSFLQPPPSKVGTLIELIERARALVNDKDSKDKDSD